jgi:uncharacterized protein
MTEVLNVPEESCFEIRLDGRRIGLLDYYISGDTAVIPHTEIDPAYGGRGLGGELVKGALDELRGSGLRVRPVCSFVSHYIARHPEYAEMVREP